MTNFKFTFPALEAYPQHEGEANVVFTVHWRLDGYADGGYTAGVYGTAAVNFNSEDFVPFADLTEAIVQAWVEEALGEEQVNNYKANIEKQIEAQKAPQSVVLTPPWVVVEEVTPVTE